MPLRWVPHCGGSQPQRPPGRPGRVSTRSHAPQFPQFPVQRAGLTVRLPFLLLLEQGGLLFLQVILRDARCALNGGLCCGFTPSAASLSERSSNTQEREPGTRRVREKLMS